jgi:hypothetical protein
MRALREVLETYGIPGAMYTDRAGWAAYTPTSGTAPDRTKLTQATAPSWASPPRPAAVASGRVGPCKAAW